MSDPVTNVEIEDVLSSIRKLVSEGEQARTRDSESVAPAPSAPAEAAAEPRESKPAKLVLTPAFMVSDGVSENETAEPAAEMTVQEEAQAAPDLSEIVWEEVDEAPLPEPAEAEDPAGIDAGADTGADADAQRRSELEATIAELEASVGSEEFEPDGSEEAEEVQALVWPGHHQRDFDSVEDAELDEEPAAQDAAVTDDADDEAEADEARFDEDAVLAEDDELDAYLQGDQLIDEAALRQLVSEIVREELQGSMGERITRNVRKLVRREIYRILSSQEFD